MKKNPITEESGDCLQLHSFPSLHAFSGGGV